MSRLSRAALVAVALGLAACRPAALVPPTAQSAQAHAITGAVSFEERTAQIAPTTLTSLATITLINASNQTVATARTNAAGAFTLLPGAGFTVAAGDLFFMDAYKGTNDNRVGGNVARLRTILQWTANGWTSTSGATVVINPLTTAVCAIQGLQPGSIAASATLGTVAGATVTSGNATINANWGAVNALVRDLLAKDQDPLARITLVGTSYVAVPDATQPLIVENFRTGTFADTRVDAAGILQLSAPRPTVNDPASELDYFSAANVAPGSSGAITTDGTYLYVKAWAGYTPGIPHYAVIKRIGTGFNGTIRGVNYGTLGPAVTPTGISMAYLDGFVYATMGGNLTQLFKIATSNGNSALVDLPVSLLNYQTGLNNGGHPLISTDGTYLYNLSWGIGGTLNNGFTVQILDPRQGFSLVRKFTMDTSSYYTDGFYVDGTYLYPQEWSSGNSGRMRRYRLSDGAREAEWTFSRVNDWSLGSTAYNPAVNNPIGTCWDPYNWVFWSGNLTNEKIHLMRGGRHIPTGTWQSAALDAGTAAPLYGRLTWTVDLQGSDGLSFQVRSADSVAALASATWYGPRGTTDHYLTSGTPLNSVHAKNRYLQVRATLSSATLTTTPKLSRLSFEVLP